MLFNKLRQGPPQEPPAEAPKLSGGAFSKARMEAARAAELARATRQPTKLGIGNLMQRLADRGVAVPSLPTGPQAPAPMFDINNFIAPNLPPQQAQVPAAVQPVQAPPTAMMPQAPISYGVPYAPQYFTPAPAQDIFQVMYPVYPR